MNRYFSVFAHHRIVLIIPLFFAALFLFLPISSSTADEIDAGEELISLSAKNEPLGDVLYKVSMATGYDISLDNKWQNYRVTASLEKVPLHKGLKRILKNLNSAIIYVSSKKIPKVFNGFGVAIVSTPRGIMTDKEARLQNVGGEIICNIW